MKKFLSVTAVIVCTTAISFAGNAPLPASGNPINKSASFTRVTACAFGSLNGHRMGKGTSLTWKMVAEDGVDHYMVKRTYTDPTDIFSVWETVGSMVANGARSYNVREDAVYPGYLYYKVIAVMQDGSTVESAVEPIRIVAHK